MKEHCIAWWNLENLFDIENSTERDEWLKKKLTSELKRWTKDVLAQKLTNLASIIKKINSGKGPDIMGICEVENKTVVTKLLSKINIPGRKYEVEHHDMSDSRGIDVAFIYDSKKFKADNQFSYTVLKRESTRDIFQVNFISSSGNELIIIGNHWPSRSAGEYESEPYRIIAAETLSYWHSRIIELKKQDVPILAMGDFNDEPFSRSVRDYALSINSLTKVLKATDEAPKFINLMFPAIAEGKGTFYFGNFPFVFDQFWLSKGLLDGKQKFSLKKDSLKIESFEEMTRKGDYPCPIHYSRPSAGKEYNPKGFSDHFPISLIITEK